MTKEARLLRSIEKLKVLNENDSQEINRLLGRVENRKKRMRTLGQSLAAERTFELKGFEV
jgi:hypothetical protein